MCRLLDARVPRVWRGSSGRSGLGVEIFESALDVKNRAHVNPYRFRTEFSPLAHPSTHYFSRPSSTPWSTR